MSGLYFELVDRLGGPARRRDGYGCRTGLAERCPASLFLSAWRGLPRKPFRLFSYRETELVPHSMRRIGKAEHKRAEHGLPGQPAVNDQVAGPQTDDCGGTASHESTRILHMTLAAALNLVTSTRSFNWALEPRRRPMGSLRVSLGPLSRWACLLTDL